MVVVNKYSNFNSKDALLSFEMHFLSDTPETIMKIGRVPTEMKTTEIIYRFCIKFTQGVDYDITDDRVIICLDHQNDSQKNIHKIFISKSKGEIVISDNIYNETKTINYKQLEMLKHLQRDEKELLAYGQLLNFILPNWYGFIAGIAICDLDPKALKTPTITSKFSLLRDDGSNLSCILENILKDDEKSEIFLNHIQSLLPFLERVSIEHHNGKVKFALKEFHSDINIPAPYVSDGTVNVIALLVFMFFEDSSLAVIDELENSLHLGLLSKIFNLMDYASDDKQIIAITNNPDIIEYAPIDKALLTSRDDYGNSTLTRLRDHEMVEKFNDVVPIHTLLKQDLLS